jgi:hypothetical protein
MSAFGTMEGEQAAPETIQPLRAPRVTAGSSVVGTILGLGMWTDSTPMQAFGRMVGLVADQETDPKAAGHIMEAALLLHWEKITGRTLTRCRPYEEGPEVVKDGWMHARWDGLIPKTLLVESKITQSFDEEDGWGEDGTSQIPLVYQAQLAWQMAVLDVPEAELIAIATYSRQVRRYVGIKRHRGIERGLIAKVYDWMDAHVWAWTERGEWNPPGETTYNITSARFREGGRDDREWVEPREAEVELARAYAAANEAEKAAAKEKDRIKNALCDRIGDAYGISSVATWAHGKAPDRIDMDALKQRYPEAYAACLIPGDPNRRFNLKWKDPNAPAKAPKSKKTKET